MIKESIIYIEEAMARFFDKTPRLPFKARTWIVANLWWFVFAFALLTAVALVFAGLSLALVIYVGRFGLVSPVEISSLLFAAVITVIMFAAITPLKEYHSRGWRLLFVAELVSIASIVVECILLFNDFPWQNLILGLVLTAAELYILFAVRKDFETRVSKAKIAATAAKVKAKAKKTLHSTRAKN